jgi:glycosyltransferase involved in cell wall biosynthesis
LKIAVWHNLPSGGGKRALYNHVKVLKEKGHVLEAWTTDISSDSYLPLSDLIKENRKPVRAKYSKMSLIPDPFKREKKITGLMMDHAAECAREIEQLGFDLVFANSCLITTVPFISHFSVIPTVLYLGEHDRRLFEADSGKSPWALKINQFTLKGINRFRKDLLRNFASRLRVKEQTEAAHKYSKLLVNSIFSSESVKRSYGLNAEVCYLGADEKIFIPGEKNCKKPYAVGLGRISGPKNPELAITVISRIEEKSRPELHWVSNDPVSDHLEFSRKLAEKNGVIFTVHSDISDNELINLLQQASVMIGTSHLEPFGLAPVEANMCGTWAVAVAEGGYRESLKQGENGFLFSAVDIIGMAECVNKFCSDPEYSFSMGMKARSYAENHWGFSSMAENIENALTAGLK